MKVILFSTLFLFIAWFMSSCVTNKDETTDTTTNQSWSLAEGAKLVDSTNYSLELLELDSTQYFQFRGSGHISEDKNKVIKDAKRAQQLLQGIVDFEAQEHDLALKSIYFRNGGVFTSSNFEYPIFIAYYPDEDVLVCEGGHSTDILFNLSTGVQEISNPDFTFKNPSNTLRFGHYYNGQASEFMIEKKYNNHFQKVIDIDEIISQKAGYVFEMIKEVKWLNDSTFILKALDAYHLKTEEYKTLYYKVTLLKINKSFHHETAFIQSDPKSFVSKDDKILQTFRADLNGDKKMDIVYLTQQNYEWLIKKDEDGNNVNQNRRGIIVALNNGNAYELIVNNPSCFYSDNEYGGNYFAPELDLQVEKQQLFIHFSHGRYGYWHYQFALQKKKMMMVEYFNNYSRGPVTQEETTINFLTKTKYIDDNINKDSDYDEDIKMVRSTTKVSINQLINLAQIENFEELDLDKLLEFTSKKTE